MEDNVLGLSRTLSKVGGSMLICLAFVVLAVGLAESGVRVTNWMILVGLVPLALLLRLNVARVDRKYEREAEARRAGR